MSKLDVYYRKLILTKFFTKGWGSVNSLSKIVSYRRGCIGNREECLKLVSDNYKIDIDEEVSLDDHYQITGSFHTPLANYISDIMPEEIHSASFQVLIPKKWNGNFNFNGKNLKPMCIHFGGTGDHFFWRRRKLVAKPLLEEHSIGSIILENPFYGTRKPKNQMRSSLHHVSDLFIMGGSLVAEAVVLMKWCERLGYGPFVLTGMSMGGHMASLAATVWPKPVGLLPFLSWSTASSVFTRGVLSDSVPWDLLEKQFYGNKEYAEIKHKIEYQNRLLNQTLVGELPQLIPNFEIQHGHSYLSVLNTGNHKINNIYLKNYNPIFVKNKIDPEIFDFMQLLMDECTNLINFDKPLDTSLIHILLAHLDAYIPRDGVHDLRSIWPGCKVEYIEQGHVAAILLGLKQYRQAIRNNFDLLISKHYIDSK